MASKCKNGREVGTKEPSYCTRTRVSNAKPPEYLNLADDSTDDLSATEVCSRSLNPFPGSGRSLEKAAAWFRGCHAGHDCEKRESHLSHPARLLSISPGAGLLRVTSTAEQKARNRYATLSMAPRSCFYEKGIDSLLQAIVGEGPRSLV